MTYTELENLCATIFGQLGQEYSLKDEYCDCATIGFYLEYKKDGKTRSLRLDRCRATDTVYLCAGGELTPDILKNHIANN